jgi:hypothetical protein
MSRELVQVPLTDTTEIGRLWRWALHRGNANNPLASAVRSLFRQAQRWADRVAEIEQLRIDLAIARAALKAYQNRGK